MEKQRDSPRNSESKLAPAKDLDALYNELSRFLKDAESFIARVFNSNDKIWVERCGSIIQD